MCCVVVCDLETSRIGAPYIYDISRLRVNKHLHLPNFHSCTLHSDVIRSFINPTNAQLICFKILKFALKYITIAPTCFGLTKPSLGSLQSVLR